jgi:hypothetical protein
MMPRDPDTSRMLVQAVANESKGQHSTKVGTYLTLELPGGHSF